MWFSVFSIDDFHWLFAWFRGNTYCPTCHLYKAPKPQKGMIGLFYDNWYPSRSSSLKQPANLTTAIWLKRNIFYNVQLGGSGKDPIWLAHTFHLNWFNHHLHWNTLLCHGISNKSQQCMIGSRDQTLYQILTGNPVKLPDISSGKNTLSFNFLMEEAEAGSWKLVLQWGG